MSKQKSIRKPGYHIRVIQKGVLGQSSKLLEEVYELIDAEDQQCKVMVLVELSDLVGSIEAYLQANFPEISIQDLTTMARITKRAFENGTRM